MRYHIFHIESEPFNFHDWDVTEDFVKQIVGAYLRGFREVRINGENYKIGSNLMIYENPPMQGASGVLAESMIKLEATKANFSKIFFEKKFKNVTDRFIQGRTWGDLKEDYFNVYINDGQNKQVILVLNEIEVQDFLSKWALGENSIWVTGRRINLKDPKSIKIYNISLEWLSKDRGDIRSNIRKHVQLSHNGSYTIAALEFFGKEGRISSKSNPLPRNH